MTATMTLGKSKHPILIVDDEPDVLTSLRSLFRRDYQVCTAPSAGEALGILARQEIHVVLSDQRMPGMTGADFLAKVAVEHPSVIRLMITGYADLESVIAAINRGHVYRYISKPWEPRELEAAVRQATDQYELQRERRRLLKELEEANRLKTAFITVASHELNTPLTIAAGMLELAQGKTRDEVVESYLRRAQQATKRLRGLLARTFRVLRDEHFEPILDRSNVICQDLLREIAQELEPFLKLRGQDLRITVEPPELTVHASMVHLRDVLENLFSNAIKFSPDGKLIRAEARLRENQVYFQVIDEGIGIPYEDQPHIFEPFFSTMDTLRHSSGEYGFCKRGPGLGLAVAKRLLEMHGGTIGFDSTPGQGTIFWFAIPRA